MKLSLKYSIVPGGQYNGLPALFLSKHPDKKDLSEPEILSVIRDSIKAFNMKLSLLFFEYDKEHTLEEDSFLNNIIYSLSEFVKVGVIYQPYMPLFIRYTNYNIAVINNSQWHKFQANEIRYIPATNDKFNVDTGELNVAAPKFIIPNNISVSDGMKFINDAPLLWGIILPVKRYIEVEIL